MILQEVIDRFEQKAPVCVMVRAAMENVLSAERLDGLFEEAAERQANRQLMFSTVAEMMGLVACKIHPSVHAAYQAKAKAVGVTVKAVYDKLQRMESNVSRQLVAETAARMEAIITNSGGTLPELVPGYRVKILDGNHLRRTQRRLGALRKLNAAPLPGHCVVVLDPRLKLAIDVIPCEDGHAQERSLLPQVLETVAPRDLWIGDRNFCTTDFLFGIQAQRGYFLIRQHAQALRYELIGRRNRVGETETGVVYEQSMRIFDKEGRAIKIRRVTVVLHQPTRDGDTEIHLLTNLPRKVSAERVADLYRRRWTIETAFCELAQNLEGEIETLGYPRAALFAFSMALVCYNLLSVVLAALRAVHGHETAQTQLSFYYLCDEVAHTHRGLDIALPDEYWRRKYARLTPARMARALIRLARQVDLARYRKHQRGPKRPPPKMDKRRRSHVSTARVLAQSRTNTS